MIRLRAVGECLIEVGDECVGPDAEMAFAVLLLLVLSAGRPLGRGQLVDLLWPATSEPRARHNLRQTLYKLRQLGVPLESASTQVRLPADAVAPTPLLGALEGPPPAELLRPDAPFGEFLAGYAPDVSAAFSAWVDEQRGVMHARLRRSVLALLDDERRRGHWGAVESLARKCLQLDPLNEEATLALAEATALAGSKRTALAVLDAYLADLGEHAGELRLPAAVLRRRISERLPAGAAPSQADPPFVGRAESMAFLVARYRLARHGAGQAALVWGDAGLGKSRLLTEFGRLAVLEGAQLARVGCQPRDADRPLSLFVDVVPQLLGIPGAAGCSPETMDYLRRLTAHDPAVVEPSAATREAELLFAGVRRAILDLIDAVASEAPLVLCLEDVHWLDEQSWRVLRELIGWLPPRAVLLLLTSRRPHATATPPARPAPGLQVHRLPPLDQEASLALFDAVTATSVAPAAFRDWSLEVGDGNPLHMQILGNHWVDTASLDAPPAIEDFFAERLARLASIELQVLRACAILDVHSTVGRLSRMLHMDQHQLTDTLAVLEDSRLLAQRATSFECRNAVLARVVIRDTAPAKQIMLHRCAALAIESDSSEERSTATLWACAHHWLQAGQRSRALDAAKACASHALALGLPAVAADIWERSLGLCETRELRVEVLLQRADALYHAGQWHQVLTALEQLETEISQTPWRTAMPASIGARRLEAQLRTGRDTTSLLSHATALAANPNVPKLQRLDAIASAMLFAENSLDEAKLEQVHQQFGALIASSRGEPSALRAEAIYHNAVGDPLTAVRSALAYVACERDTGDAARLSRALRNASIPLRTAGLIDEAFDSVLEAYDVASKHQLPSSTTHSADVLATLNLMLGLDSEAEEWIAKAEWWGSQLDEPIADTSIRRLRARICLLRSDPEQALTLLKADLDRDAIHSDSTNRSRLDAAALLLLAYTRLGERPCAERLFNVFAPLYERGRSFHGQELSSAACFSALRLLGRRDEADRSLQAYLDTYRRERHQQSPEMLRALAYARGL